MEDVINLSLAAGMELAEGLDLDKNNVSLMVPPNISDDITAETDPEYEQFLADVWVGIVLTLMVLSCVCCMCSCLLYHKFQQWKRSGKSQFLLCNIRNMPNNRLLILKYFYSL